MVEGKLVCVCDLGEPGKKHLLIYPSVPNGRVVFVCQYECHDRFPCQIGDCHSSFAKLKTW